MLLTIDQALQQAVGLHQGGQLVEAENIYQTILQNHPKHPESNHNLGIIELHRHNPSASLAYFMAALDANPANGQYWLSYIDALIQSGRLHDARDVLALAQSHGLDGDGDGVDSLTSRLEQQVQLSEAIEVQNDGISPELLPTDKKNKAKSGKTNKPSKNPNQNAGKVPSSQDMNSLAILFNKGLYPESAILAQQMTVRFPYHGLGWKILGSALLQMGENADALISIQKAAALLPNDIETHSDMGVILYNLGRLNEAETSYRRALQIKPNWAVAHSNLGITLHCLGRLSEAAASYRKALQLKPDYAEVYNNLGVTLKDMGQLREAEFNYRQALKINPDFAGAHNNLGICLKDLGQLDDAEACYRRAIELNPDFVDAYSNLGGTLHDSGRLDEAEANYRHALTINPNLADVRSNLLFSLSQNATVSAKQLFAEHCKFGEMFEPPFLANRPPFHNTVNSARKLRVGFVSGDFRNHAVAYFIEPALTFLATYPQLALYAYTNNVMSDVTTQRLRQYFTEWNLVSGMTDDALAEKIRADAIDILIDLSGHTAHNRLLTFVRKPAPVQVSWMGYPCTTGLKAMDYYLTDRSFLPPGEFDNQFTEKIVQIPASVPFLPSKNAPPINELPALSNGYITFGSFNRPSKLSSSVIALWAKLLRELPDSRLVLGGMALDGKHNALIAQFAKEGITQNRLVFYARSDLDSYLGLHNQVDICLDTFPYNGGTTTLHALWMGVPTLTLAGSTPAGRSGASILSNVDLREFIAVDAADFIQKAIYWSGNLAVLSDIRAELRERFTRSTTGQPAMVAAGVERALNIMWQRWSAGLPPETFEVTSDMLTT